MTRKIVLVALACLLAHGCYAATFTVRNTNDSGNRSLRWAIVQANGSVGPDVIRFAPRLAGKVIRPLTPLPAISDSRTVINGDINGNGAPDIVLNGKLQFSGSGLRITGSKCTVRGLAIINFPSRGIALENSTRGKVYGCHIGVNLAGTKALPNAFHEIIISKGSDHTIGGTTAARRNILGGGPSDGTGVYLSQTSGNTIIGNYIGLNRAGTSAVGSGHYGVWDVSGSANRIGGSSPGEGNVFGGLEVGIVLTASSDMVIAGNYFGLAANGNTVVPMTGDGIRLNAGASNNTIGGGTAAARNVFARVPTGIWLFNSGTEGNKIQGNYFGTNAAGTRQRRLGKGIFISHEAGAQVIGGSTSARGNFFVCKDPKGGLRGILLISAGAGTLIRHNTFGVRPGGGEAAEPMVGIHCSGVANVRIADNLIAQATYGILCDQPGSNPKAFGNTFRHCSTAVQIMVNGRCVLGNLSNGSAADDGGNVFRPSNTWYIRNDTPNRIRAEGNDFGTTSRAAIDAKIIDKLDWGSYGRVDFSPLKGNVLPTGVTLAVTGTAALPTKAGGAEIIFNLSTPADVTISILNIAGRPVATVAQDRRSDAGLQRIAWSGRSGQGTPAPAGRYLVRVTARDDNGAQVCRLTTLTLGR